MAAKWFNSLDTNSKLRSSGKRTASLKIRIGFMRLDSTIAETLFSLPSTITTYFHSRSSNKSKVELLFHLVEGPSQLQCSSIAYLDVKSFLSSELSHLDFSFKLYWCSIVCKIIFNFLWNLKIKTVCLKTFSSDQIPNSETTNPVWF